MIIKFTDNKQIRDNILHYIKEEGHCPVSGAGTLSAPFQCPCDYFDNIEEGVCGCGLLVKIKDPWDR